VSHFGIREEQGKHLGEALVDITLDVLSVRKVLDSLGCVAGDSFGVPSLWKTLGGRGDKGPSGAARKISKIGVKTWESRHNDC